MEAKHAHHRCWAAHGRPNLQEALCPGVQPGFNLCLLSACDPGWKMQAYIPVLVLAARSLRP